MFDNYDCFLVVSARLSLGLSAWISYSSGFYSKVRFTRRPAFCPRQKSTTKIRIAETMTNPKTEQTIIVILTEL